MHLTIIHKSENQTSNSNQSVLRFALSCEPIADFILSGLKENSWLSGDNEPVIAAPESWYTETSFHHSKLTYYNGSIPAGVKAEKKNKANSWYAISNARFVVSLNNQRINKILTNTCADLISINVDPALVAYREKVKIASQNNIAGFRRIYSDSILPSLLPADWPHCVFIKREVFNKILVENTFPTFFTELIDRCKSGSINLASFRVGGKLLDLETEEGLLGFIATKLRSNCSRSEIPANTRILGNVVLGKNVQIGDNVVIVGPTILCDDVKIASEAIIKTAVIGPSVSLPKACFVQNRILIDTKHQCEFSSRHSKIFPPQLEKINLPSTHNGTTYNNFRYWSKFSYTRFLKRFIDIIISLIALMFLAPLFPVIAVIIKLSSQGPIFFKHKRQGLHGTEFYCLKFRTMIIGADKIQEKLRFKNQVDGPQFKVEDDPRVTMVGKFMRDIFLDEVPQFINILFGEMSLVGPRPSPKTENSLCPFWRDARLSVRPGVTGLWQVCRTREPGCDFQEWIHYDIKYIKDLSFRLDLWICWQTAKKFITNFLKQF